MTRSHIPPIWQFTPLPTTWSVFKMGGLSPNCLPKTRRHHEMRLTAYKTSFNAMGDSAFLMEFGNWNYQRSVTANAHFPDGFKKVIRVVAEINFRESCQPAFKNSQLFSLHIWDSFIRYFVLTRDRAGTVIYSAMRHEAEVTGTHWTVGHALDKI